MKHGSDGIEPALEEQGCGLEPGDTKGDSKWEFGVHRAYRPFIMCVLASFMGEILDLNKKKLLMITDHDTFGRNRLNIVCLVS